jgi:hypothetical protein
MFIGSPPCCPHHGYYVQYGYNFEVFLLANVSFGGTQKWIFSQDDSYGNAGNLLPESSPFYPKNFDASTGLLPPYVYTPGCTFPLNSTAPLAGTWLADSGMRGPPCCAQSLSFLVSFLVVALRAALIAAIVPQALHLVSPLQRSIPLRLRSASFFAPPPRSLSEPQRKIL